MESPISYFSCLSDPRIDRTKANLLDDIIFIAIVSVLCGAEAWNDMEEFGNWMSHLIKITVENEQEMQHKTFRY